MAGHCFIDRVIDDFPHQVVQAGGSGGADVHTGPGAHSFEPLEDRYVLSLVRFVSADGVYCHLVLSVRDGSVALRAGCVLIGDPRLVLPAHRWAPKNPTSQANLWDSGEIAAPLRR